MLEAPLPSSTTTRTTYGFAGSSSDAGAYVNQWMMLTMALSAYTILLIQQYVKYITHFRYQYQ